MPAGPGSRRRHRQASLDSSVFQEASARALRLLQTTRVIISSYSTWIYQRTGQDTQNACDSSSLRPKKLLFPTEKRGQR